MDQIDERRLGYIPVTQAFTEEEVPEGFPLLRWQAQIETYTDRWYDFLGHKWAEEIPQQIDEDGNPVKKYPLRINPMMTFSIKHASVLLGEIPDTDDAAVRTEVRPIESIGQAEATEKQIEDAQQIERFLNYIWSENNGRARQVESAVLCQFLGGCYFKVGFWPGKNKYGIWIEHLIPDIVMPVWDSGDYDHILEAYIAYRIPAREAYLKYGISDLGSATTVVYVEHWTEKDYSIYINGEPLSGKVMGVDTTFNKLPNPFGFVPIVYIPRIRVGGFFGLPLTEQGVEGLSEEYNIRMADMGDILQQAANQTPSIKNTQNVTSVELPDGQRAINLGYGRMNGRDPDITWKPVPNLQGGLSDLDGKLWAALLREGGLSNISFGEDEGSQRSALTLAFRMWPTTSLATIVRANWTAGLISLNKKILKIAALKVKEHAALFNEALSNMKLSCNWAPMIPRDREQVINEVVLLYSTSIIDMENAIERLGDVKDPGKLVERVKAELEWKSKLQAEQKQMPSGVNEPVAEAITGDG